jgi:16S rRNA (uracil1498-N3)-methyltransferase
MRQNRVFRQGQLKSGQQLQLTKEEAHHLVNVLRMKAGQDFTLFNGDGPEYLCRILSVEKRGLSAEVISASEPERESPVSITLVQAIARTQHMDLALQKATELGVTRIQPLLTERCAIKQGRQQLEKKEAHWLGVIISACEQSGRTFLPELLPAISLDEYLACADSNALKITLSPAAEQSFRDLQARPAQPVQLLIGPEGGLSDTEISRTIKQGFTAVSMGPRILRTETAAMAAITLIQGLWGDLG